MKSHLDKVGAVGAFFAAAAGCPACFPLLAIVGSALGLSFLRPYEGVMLILFQVLVFLGLLGNILSYLKHHQLFILTIGILSPLLIFFSLYIRRSEPLIYIGLFGLVIAAILNTLFKRKCPSCEKSD